jgi:hypothetical protein
MGILRKKITKTESRKYLGVNIPGYVSNYLTLFAISFEESKSFIIKHLLIKWHREWTRDKGLTKENLLIRLADKLHTDWRYPPGRRMNFNTFILSLEIELKRKRIEEEDIETLINMVKDEKEKGDKEEGKYW